MYDDDNDNEDHRPPIELLTPPRGGPFEHVKRALHSGFCDYNNAAPTRHRASSSDGVSIESTETSWTFEPTILVGNFKQLVQEGFCGPLEQVVTRPKSDETHCGSTFMTRSFDSNDMLKESFERELFHDDEGEFGVIETRPGKGRGMRVLRGLETFFFTILVMVGTMYTLRELGVNLDIQVHPKLAGEASSSFISFSRGHSSGLQLGLSDATTTALTLLGDREVQPFVAASSGASWWQGDGEQLN